MNHSISFDRAAEIYDKTREFPEPVANQGIQAILDAAGLRARILDVGTGTGRISAPLLRYGADLVGCDLSAKMMAQLRQKMPAVRLSQADASRLPFPTGHFDAVTTCHVMHLVGPWREALIEYRRVLKPGGAYINARTEDREGSAGERIEKFWEERVVARGASFKRPGVQDEKELHAELIRLGATVSTAGVVPYIRMQTARGVLDRIEKRTDSQTWAVPDVVFAETVRETREWADRVFSDLDESFEEQVEFIVEAARFDG